MGELEVESTVASAKTVLEIATDQLDARAIIALAERELSVFRVKAFVAAQVCALIAERAENHGYSSYLNVPSVRRIGMAFYETEGRSDLIEKYFADAPGHLRDFRRACEPYCSPIDILRCTLDEVWPYGANLQTLEQRKMFIGLSRMVKAGTTFLAHHDIFSEDARGRPEAISLKAQFGANVYLQMPETGGALLMWNSEILPAEFDRLRGSEYGLPVELLGPPDVVVRPDPGDLLIFNSRKMHAVSSGTGKSRLAVSCFVGYRGRQQALTYWS